MPCCIFLDLSFYSGHWADGELCTGASYLSSASPLGVFLLATGYRELSQPLWCKNNPGSARELTPQGNPWPNKDGWINAVSMARTILRHMVHDFSEEFPGGIISSCPQGNQLGDQPLEKLPVLAFEHFLSPSPYLLRITSPNWLPAASPRPRLC